MENINGMNVPAQGNAPKAKEGFLTRVCKGVKTGYVKTCDYIQGHKWARRTVRVITTAGLGFGGKMLYKVAFDKGYKQGYDKGSENPKYIYVDDLPEEETEETEVENEEPAAEETAEEAAAE